MCTDTPHVHIYYARSFSSHFVRSLNERIQTKSSYIFLFATVIISSVQNAARQKCVVESYAWHFAHTQSINQTWFRPPRCFPLSLLHKHIQRSPSDSCLVNWWMQKLIFVLQASRSRYMYCIQLSYTLYSQPGGSAARSTCKLANGRVTERLSAKCTKGTICFLRIDFFSLHLLFSLCWNWITQRRR